MLTNVEDILSEEVMTPEDFISGDFCLCNHKLEEHFKGTISGTSKCFGLNFNGTVWESCKCIQVRSYEYSISVTVPNYADNSQIRASN